jgi:hypothetical protein
MTDATQRRQRIDRWAIAAVIGLIVILGVVSCVASCFKRDPHHDLESIAQCEARISKLLKAPATANFDSSTTTDGTGWTVTGTVDSENSFGANVRSDYQCTVVMNSNNTATTTVDYLNE